MASTQKEAGAVDDKTLNALSTTLALFQIQLNALMLLVDRSRHSSG